MKAISPTLFLVIILCFFLPFFEVSCAGKGIIDITGSQLAFGSEVGTEKQFREVEVYAMAIIPFFLAIGGILKGVWNVVAGEDNDRDVLSAILGFAILVCLLILPSTIKTDYKLPANTQFDIDKIFEIKPQFGYYITVLLALGATILNVINFRGRKTNYYVPVDPALENLHTKIDLDNNMSSENFFKFCGKCGNNEMMESKFCSKCGNVLP